MSAEKNLLAFDCSNSTLRTTICRFDGKQIKQEIILSESNEILKIGDYFYWDLLRIFSFMKRGLEAASRMVHIDACGISTWGIDFMLFDEYNNMLSNSLCYRNTLGAQELAHFSEEDQREMFYRTGILCNRMNTIFTLLGMKKKMPSIISAAKKILLVPDVLTYFMTGIMQNEPSEISTSQLIDVRDMTISEKQFQIMDLDPRLLQPFGKHGDVIGNIKREILDELHIDYDIPFICTPSHDTASAVFGIPSNQEEYLFISSGTWALIGAQLNNPILSEDVIDGELTNEVGAYGKITLLKNSIGMFIPQRLRMEYQRECGQKISWDQFTQIGEQADGEVGIFDVNDPDLFNPTHMGQTIHSKLYPHNKNKSFNWPEIIASTYYSLAESYCVGLRAVMHATKRDDKTVYIVGGGSKIELLNQYCADKLGIRVVACDMECTTMGNAAVQLGGLYPDFSYSDLKQIIVSSLKTDIYLPKNGDFR